jgi:iron complex outermembrane recepter protein
VDIAGTLHFGPHFSIYDAVSFNDSRFASDYLNGTAVVPTKNKRVPASPDWLNKTVISVNYGHFDAQLVGDYIGRRYATFTNDLSVDPYFTLAAQIGFDVPLSGNGRLKKMRVSLNVTNITDKKAESTITVAQPTFTYNYFPLAPRQVFGTLSFGF